MRDSFLTLEIGVKEERRKRALEKVGVLLRGEGCMRLGHTCERKG